MPNAGNTICVAHLQKSLFYLKKYSKLKYFQLSSVKLIFVRFIDFLYINSKKAFFPMQRVLILSSA